ncbi:MAG: crossover junction endodeoxyribonuclease RuvC [bacterium]|jgi:crossover junction endodeoxyribonuclease RuvC|nr:crossover junction endodeoxyribonuclease RuvC [bacterium]
MRVLGIDPGLARTGYGLVDGIGGRLRSIDYGVITTAGDFPDRLVQLFRRVSELVALHSPDALSIEQVFKGPNVLSLVKLAHARAAAILAAGQRGLPVAEYTPMQIKRAVTGHGGADKTQVNFMITQVLGLGQPPRPLDASDALAAAICHLNRAGRPLPAGR